MFSPVSLCSIARIRPFFKGCYTVFMWLLLAFLSAFTAALVAIFGKLGLSKIDTTLATTIRSIIMAGFLLIVSLSLSKWKDFSIHGITGKQWWYIVLAGVAGALSWLFYFSALRVGHASKVAAVDRLSVALVFIMSILFLGEKFSWIAAIGATLMVGGAILMVYA